MPDTVENHALQIQNFVNAFVAVYSVLQKTPVDGFLNVTWNQYAQGLLWTFSGGHPPELLDQVLEFMDAVAATLDRVLDRGNISKYERIASGGIVSSLDTSKEKRIINIKAKIPELVQAFNKTQVFYEPSLGEQGWSAWGRT